jgi:hypothetical protein
MTKQQKQRFALPEFLHWIDPMVLHSAGLLRPAKLAGADK